MAEQQILRLGCNGLVSDPGPFSGVPDGAMTEAQNVVFRRPGVAEPRPPLQFTRDVTASGDCYGAFAFDDGTSVTTQWIGSSGWRSNGTTTVSGGFTFSQFKTRHSSYRGCGFFTSDQGIAVLDGASDTSARLAGVPRGPGFWTAIDATGTGTWLAQNYVTGYRTCIVRSLNGALSRGTPSALRYVANYGATTAAVNLRIFITSDVVSGDYIEVYRCDKVLGVLSGSALVGYPADEPTLRTAIRVSSGDIATGYIDFSDRLDDSMYNGA